MFKTTGTMDEMTIRETAPLLIGRWRTWFYAGLAAVMLLFAVECFSPEGWGYSAFFLAMALICLLLPTVLLPRLLVKGNLRRMRENGAESVDYETRFEEAGVFVENKTQGVSVTLPYTALRVLARTKRLLVLRTAAGQIVLVFRTQLGAEQERALIEFLKQKPTKIRRWPKIK